MTILCKSPSSNAPSGRAAARPVDMLVSTCRFCHPIFVVPLTLGLFFCLAVLPAKSDPMSDPKSDKSDPNAVTSDSFASPWTAQAAGAAEMRLIAMPPFQGTYETAVEIKLAPSAITYWRQPGEAGVPPEFSFDGSVNVAQTRRALSGAEPSRRRRDRGLRLSRRRHFSDPREAADATKPVRLALTLNYAICDRICVPAKGHAELLLPQSGDSPQRAAIMAAEARVPVALLPAEVAEKVAIHAEPGQAKPQWPLVWQGTEPAADLFAEAPDGWAFEIRKEAENKFSLVAVAMPSRPPADVLVRMTLTSAKKSYDFTVPLSVAPGALERFIRSRRKRSKSITDPLPKGRATFPEHARGARLPDEWIGRKGSFPASRLRRSALVWPGTGASSCHILGANEFRRFEDMLQPSP